MYSTHVADGGSADGVVPMHPTDRQQRKLAEAWSRLGPKYEMAYCTHPLCEWFVRSPKRLGQAVPMGYQHLKSAHFMDLLAGIAAPPFGVEADGGAMAADLAARSRMVIR